MLRTPVAWAGAFCLFAVASGCSSAPPEDCVRAGARLKQLASSGPSGYDSPEIPGLLSQARTHRDNASAECRSANFWADDFEKARPKATARPVSAPASVAAPAPGATVSQNAIHTCNRNCESALDRCAASAGCRLGTYKRAGDDGHLGFGDTNTITHSCTKDPATAAGARDAVLLQPGQQLLPGLRPVVECVDRLIDTWKTRGVAFNRGVSPARLKQFERRHDVKLPRTLSDLLLEANGTETEDEWGFRFMPIDEIVPGESFLSFSRAGLSKSFDARDPGSFGIRTCGRSGGVLPNVSRTGQPLARSIQKQQLPRDPGGRPADPSGVRKYNRLADPLGE